MKLVAVHILAFLLLTWDPFAAVALGLADGNKHHLVVFINPPITRAAHGRTLLRFPPGLWPSSLAEETERFIRRNIDSPTPEGWGNQIEDEPAIVISWEQKWRAYASYAAGAWIHLPNGSFPIPNWNCSISPRRMCNNLERVFSDLSALQDTIAIEIPAAFGVEYKAAELARVRRVQTDNLSAYESRAVESPTCPV